MSPTRDRGLAVRMLATLATVLAANTLFVGVLGYVAVPWLGPFVRGAAVRVGVPGTVAALWWLPAAVALVVLATWAQLRYVRRETLSAVGATRASAEVYPDLHRIVRRLSTQANVPTPELFVVDSETPNSFALGGFGPPVIAVSTGLVAELDDDALEAVLAHEFAHLQHRDASVMTLASFLPALTSDRHSLLSSLGPTALVRAAIVFALAGLYAAGAVANGTSIADPGYALGFLGSLVAVAVVGAIALGVFATLTTVLARRLSHYREFAADRGAAALTGDPAALAEALGQLHDDRTTAPEADKRRAYRDVQGLCLLPHGFGNDEAADDDGFHVETRSHPPTDERVARLRDLIDG